MPWLPSRSARGIWSAGICLAALCIPSFASSPSAPAPATKPTASQPHAAPAPPPKPSAPPTSTAIPDYGGRDDPGALAGAGSDAPDPAAQVGRSLLALVIVLGGVVGVMYLLRRAGYTGGPVGPALTSGFRQLVAARSGGQSAVAPAAPPRVTDGPMSLLQSQSLPGGGTVHLLSVHEKTLVLIGATGQSVSLLAEWEQTPDASPETAAETPPADFSAHLARIDSGYAPVQAPSLGPNNAVSDILASNRPGTATGKHE